MPLPNQPGDFTQQADAYARARPHYPSGLLNQLIDRAQVRPGDRVADIGAGTGILTEQLAAHGFIITAIEPNAAMRNLALRLPNVTWAAGTFERTGLGDGSQHWVIAAQAFHWADPVAALPELRRVLAPGRQLTVLWNNRDNEANPIVDWTRRAIDRHVPDFTPAYRNRDWAAVLASTGDFTDVRYDEAHHIVPMSRQRYLDLWRSHNRLNTIAGPERFAAFLSELQDHLAAHEITTIDVPYRSRAWTARRGVAAE